MRSRQIWSRRASCHKALAPAIRLSIQSLTMSSWRPRSTNETLSARVVRREGNLNLDRARHPALLIVAVPWAVDD